MKPTFLSMLAVGLLFGCLSSSGDETPRLKPLVAADMVKVFDNMGRPVLGGTITNVERIEKLVSFVDSLHQNWSVAGYALPVGRIYFDFYKGETNVGNFYIGPDFFGRNIYYRYDHIQLYSQSATEIQIKRVGEIVGFDMWKYVHAP